MWMSMCEEPATVVPFLDCGNVRMMLWTAPPRAAGAMIVGAVKASLPQEFVMHTVTTIGLDIAKSVFQVHGIDAHGRWSSAVS